MTDAERQRRRYARKKAGLVRVQEWVPEQAEVAVRAAIEEALAKHEAEKDNTDEIPQKASRD
jgi:hypothetical protein